MGGSHWQSVDLELVAWQLLRALLLKKRSCFILYMKSPSFLNVSNAASLLWYGSECLFLRLMGV